MFKPFCTYSHPKMLDCNILVLKAVRIKDGRYQLKVRWFNKRGLDLCVQEPVVVKAENVKEWYLC